LIDFERRYLAVADSKVHDFYRGLLGEVGKVVVGQIPVLEELCVAIICGGHVLLEGVPGIAKTLMIKTLARLLGCEFRRIQFTPDLMPSDVTGTHVFDGRTASFHLKKGPIFTNLLLADEINRTPPKTQSALLEGMEERQVTVEGESLKLPYPFIVFATQNPVEFEGTYPLPEAQVDRFFLKVLISYPTPSEEREIMKKFNEGFDHHNLDAANLEPQGTPAVLSELRREVLGVTIRDDIIQYILDIVKATRNNINLNLGASPRGSVFLLQAAKALAAMSGRAYTIPDDVKRLVGPVLRHRILLRPEAEIEGMAADDVLKGILGTLQVPR
jgi:MoxR-like ATPase